MRIALAAILLAAWTQSGTAADCPGNADALGTERVLTVDVTATPRVGRQQFPQTLPLADKEVVLTFDDGPWPQTTGAVLDILKRDCVQATFFLLGRNVAAEPLLVRREQAEGHTIAFHSYSHPLLNRMTPSAAEADIDKGVAAIDAALAPLHPAAGAAQNAPQDVNGNVAGVPSAPILPNKGPVTRFFRFPGFASTPLLLDRLNSRGFVVFGADLWASDWNPMTPQQQLALILARLRHAGRGIILFHDTKRQTAAMLPQFLKALKAGGYKVVHVRPTPPAIAQD